MKYLLILAIVLGVLWLLKNKRRLDSDDQPPVPPARQKKPGTPAIATEIVACDVCQVHLPRSEALTGPKGVYCSAAHRQQAGAG
ncbi:MAG: PP0621 family protein [Pseudomonadota bacterium]